MTVIPDTTRLAGEAIRGRRRLLGLTQLDLANLCGVNRETVVRAEAGDGGVAFGTLVRLAAAVGLEISVQPRYRDS
jgi:transcriptional regulator with XRE-family HTH domain